MSNHPTFICSLCSKCVPLKNKSAANCPSAAFLPPLFAERTRFELVIHFWRIHAFQACLFNHSSTSPYGYRAAKVMVIFEIRNKILLILILYQQKDCISPADETKIRSINHVVPKRKFN